MAKRIDGVKRDEWAKRLAKFGRVNLTVVEFCRRENVSQASFYYWAKRIRQAGDNDVIQHSTEGGCPVVSSEASQDYVEVVVDASIRVRMPSTRLDAVAALIRHLQEATRVDDNTMTNSRFQRITLARSST